MKLTTILTVTILIITGASVANAEPAITGISPYDGYGSPCDDTVEAWDAYCDLLIEGPAEQCTKITDPLINPPSEHSGQGVVQVFVAGDPAQPGEYSRHGCEIWVHPDRIHQRLGPGSVGVRIDWVPNGSLAFTVKAKVDGRDPDPEEGDPTYISPPEDEVKHIDHWGNTVTPGEQCDTFTWGEWTYTAHMVPVLEVTGVAPNIWAPAGPGGTWVAVTTPHTVYSCSF